MLNLFCACLICHKQRGHGCDKAEPILLFFHLFFFPAILFFFSYLFFSILCSSSSYISNHKKCFLVYLQLLRIHDCCIRVIHNMVTALLEYLNLLSVSKSCLWLFFWSISNFAMPNRSIYRFQTTIFQNFTYSRISFFAFSFLFFQKYCWKNCCSLKLCFKLARKKGSFCRCHYWASINLCVVLGTYHTNITCVDMCIIC